MGEVTLVLRELRARPDLFEEKLMPLVQSEMRRMARMHMRRERVGHTLQPTLLVDEALLQLKKSKMDWKDSKHFLGTAWRIMRNLLVSYARAADAEKRGTREDGVDLAKVPEPKRLPLEMVIAVHEALEQLKTVAPEQEEVIHLRFFVDLTIVEVAEVMDISETSVKKYYKEGMARLKRELTRTEK